MNTFLQEQDAGKTLCSVAVLWVSVPEQGSKTTPYFLPPLLTKLNLCHLAKEKILKGPEFIFKE